MQFDNDYEWLLKIRPWAIDFTRMRLKSIIDNPRVYDYVAKYLVLTEQEELWLCASTLFRSFRMSTLLMYCWESLRLPLNAFHSNRMIPSETACYVLCDCSHPNIMICYPHNIFTTLLRTYPHYNYFDASSVKISFMCLFIIINYPYLFDCWQFYIRSYLFCRVHGEKEAAMVLNITISQWISLSFQPWVISIIILFTTWFALTV